MKKNVNIPQWLTITGQSGSGKGTVSNLLQKKYEENGITPLFISTGNLVREITQKQNHIANQMKTINDQGFPQPAFIATSLWFSKISKELMPGQYIIHDGAPRSLEELKFMESLIRDGYLDSLKILEIEVPYIECRRRLINRTIEDNRDDLSVRGIPGTPDGEKIYTKMEWWKTNRDKIVKAIPNNMYISLKNNKGLEELENEINSLFIF